MNAERLIGRFVEGVADRFPKIVAGVSAIALIGTLSYAGYEVVEDNMTIPEAVFFSGVLFVEGAVVTAGIATKIARRDINELTKSQLDNRGEV